MYETHFVCAINGKELVIKFNNPVDPTTVVTGSAAAGYKVVSGVVSITRTGTAATDTNVISQTGSAVDLNTLAAKSAKLSEDGKTLTVIPADTDLAKYFSGTYAITVKGAKDKATGKEITAYASTFTVDDKAAPTVESLTYTIEKGFEVKFSEPLATLPTTFRINNVAQTITTANLSADGKTLTVAKPATVQGGTTASVYVAGATDGAGNLLTPYTGTASVTADTSAVTIVSTTAVAPNKVRVVFNKPIASSDTDVKNAITTLKDSVSYTSFAVAKNTTVDATGKTFDITLGTGNGPLYTDLYTASTNSANLVFAFKADAVADYAGNKLAATSASVTVNKDTTAPKVTSVTLANDGIHLLVKFDKEISSADNTKFSIRKDGVEIASSVGTTTVDSTDSTIVKVQPGSGLVTTPGTTKLGSGSYTVRLAADAVTATSGVKSAAANLDAVTVGATTTDLKATITTNQDATLANINNEFKVVYSEAVTSATALNLSNYKLDGAALPANTDIRFVGTDNKTVLITLPAGSINIGQVGASNGTTAALAVSGVQTSAGKTVVATYGTVKIEDNTPAVLQSASLVSANILKLTFSENISASGITDIDKLLSEVEIKAGSVSFSKTDVDTTTPGTSHATATATVSGKDLIITVVPGNSNWATVTGSSTVTITTKDSGSTDGLVDLILDTNGVKAKAGASVTLTK